MNRSGWICRLFLLFALAGCGTRAAPAADAALPDLALRDTGVARDAPIALDGAVPADAGGACTGLTRVGQLTLEYADTMKTTPALAFDGDRFAVAWHSQLSVISSMNGELRFALVDRTGKTSTPDGVKLAGDNGIVAPSLVAAAAEYAVVHLPVGSSGVGVVLRRVDSAGKTLGTVPISGQVSLAYLAPHPSGYAVLTAPQAGVPQVAVLDTGGAVVSTTPFITAQVMASLWLGQRSTGYVAALYSTNKNVAFHLLDNQMTEVGIASGGGMIYAPSFATLPGGLAELYLGAGAVEVKVFDSAGSSVGKQGLGSAALGSVADPRDVTALAWTGQRLVAGYPSTVPGQFLLRVLDETGRPLGGATKLSGCLATSSSIRMVWGRDVLAVATLDHASGLPNSGVCVTLLRCQ
jgi:hypothetical protein